ncbi:MAG: SDR family oxidoreductase [Oscillospiraceae bacterium]|nr:SDR family oxidoreductase [Oscillospiraceae bacterium]
MRFENKTVIITGAGGGIGTEIARKFAADGAKLALIDIKEEFALRTAEKLGLAGDRYLALAADISNEDSVKATIAKIHAHFGTVDVLLNVAGIPGPSARTEDYKFSDFKRVYEVNVFGTYLMMQNCLPIMQAQKSGVVINFGSCSGMFGYPYEIGYGSSKWAIIGMTKNAANENGANGVRINSISPGWVNTKMMSTILDSYKDVGITNSSDNVTLGPMGRPGSPVEIANVVAFMCSDEASYLNGSNWLVDGGMTLG